MASCSVPTSIRAETEIVIGFRMRGLQLEGFPVAGDGVLRMTLLLSGDAEIIVCVRLGRIERQRLLIGAHGF